MTESRNIALAKAHEMWHNGQAIDAGRIIFELLPVNARPGWAANILDLAVRRCAISCAQIDNVLHIVRHPEKWGAGHDAFARVREVSLEGLKSPQEARSPQEELLLWILVLAELVAKVAYNCTNPSDPFDEDSGWNIAGSAKGIPRLLNDELFAETLWNALSRAQ